MEKVALKNFVKRTGKHLGQSVFFKKVVPRLVARAINNGQL